MLSIVKAFMDIEAAVLSLCGKILLLCEQRRAHS